MSSELKVKRDSLFILGFLLLFIQFWTKDIFEINEYLFYLPAFMLIIISINIKNYNAKEIIIVLLINMLGIISYFFSKSMNILKVTLILSASKNRNIDKLIKYSFWTGLIIIMLHVICSTVFNIGTLYQEADFGRGEIEKRYFFGFSHAKSLYLMVNITIMCFIYSYYMEMKKVKDRYISLFIIAGVMIMAYVFTKSRTGIIMTICMLILSVIYSSKKTNITKNYKILRLMYMSIIITTIVLICFLDGTKIFNSLNNLLTGRLKFGNMFINKYGVTAFGQEVSSIYETQYGYNLNIALDQGIINPLILYGVIINTLFYMSQIMLIKKYCIAKQYKRVMIIILMIIYSITENVLFYVFSNIGILFIADLLYNSSQNRRLLNEGKTGNTDTNVQ